MKVSQIPLFALLLVATGLIVGCGDQTDPRLSNEDIAYLKQKRLQEMYGTGSTVTTTNTQVSYVTVQNTTTVTR